MFSSSTHSLLTQAYMSLFVFLQISCAILEKWENTVVDNANSVYEGDNSRDLTPSDRCSGEKGKWFISTPSYGPEEIYTLSLNSNYGFLFPKKLPIHFCFRLKYGVKKCYYIGCNLQPVFHLTNCEQLLFHKKTFLFC